MRDVQLLLIVCDRVICAWNASARQWFASHSFLLCSWGTACLYFSGVLAFLTCLHALLMGDSLPILFRRSCLLDLPSCWIAFVTGSCWETHVFLCCL